MRLNRDWIMAHIPHQGRMCLLDAVIEWDGEKISCSSSSHRDLDNPLRAHGRLGMLCGIEYAAQAMAIHGVLSADAAPSAAVPPAAPPAMGFLAAVRNVSLHAARLDDVPGQLIVTAARIAGDHASALYDFTVGSAAGRLLDGRATVVLDAGPLTS